MRLHLLAALAALSIAPAAFAQTNTPNSDTDFANHGKPMQGGPKSSSAMAAKPHRAMSHGKVRARSSATTGATAGGGNTTMTSNTH